MICKKRLGIVFDLDGVLIDSSKVVEQSFEHSIKMISAKLERKYDYSEFKKHMGKSFSEIMQLMQLPVEMYQYFIEKSIELNSEITLFDGVIALLEELRHNNCYIGIATGKDSSRTNIILREKNILHYFDKVICCDHLVNCKPSPECMHIHFAVSNLPNSDFIFVGDSIADIQCAHNSHVRSIAALWGFGTTAELMEQKSDYLASDISELRDILSANGYIQAAITTSCEVSI